MWKFLFRILNANRLVLERKRIRKRECLSEGPPWFQSWGGIEWNRDENRRRFAHDKSWRNATTNCHFKLRSSSVLINMHLTGRRRRRLHSTVRKISRNFSAAPTRRRWRIRGGRTSRPRGRDKWRSWQRGFAWKLTFSLSAPPHGITLDGRFFRGVILLDMRWRLMTALRKCWELGGRYVRHRKFEYAWIIHNT